MHECKHLGSHGENGTHVPWCFLEADEDLEGGCECTHNRPYPCKHRECKHLRFSLEGASVGSYWCKAHETALAKEDAEKCIAGNLDFGCKDYAVDTGSKSEPRGQGQPQPMDESAALAEVDGPPVGPVDVVRDGDVREGYPAAPCGDGGPALGPLVLGMAHGLGSPLANKGLPLVAVVCRRPLVGQCTRSCALGDLSRSLNDALSQMPDTSIIPV